MKPFVSIITPTTADRAAFNERCLAIVEAQTYRNFEHIMMYEQFPTLGQKMNECIKQAHGNIIVNIDSDDWYAPDWVERCVETIERTQSDVIGLKSAYFRRGNEWYSFAYPERGNLLLGATMCHTRAYWERNPYRHMQTGYDVFFTMHKCKVATLDYKDGFVATIHEGNTSFKRTDGEQWECLEVLPSIHVRY